MIPVHCPSCGHLHEFSDALAGMVMRCTHCVQRLPLAERRGTVQPRHSRLLAVLERHTEAGIIPLPPPLTASYDSVERAYSHPRLLQATRPSRFLARFLDNMLCIFSLVPGVWLANQLLGPYDAEEERAQKLLWLALLLLGPGLVLGVQAYLLSQRGQSLGKILVGIQIVHHEEGQPVGLLRGFFLRDFLTTTLSCLPFVGRLYGLIDALFIFGAEQRCLHDYLAGTRVIARR